MLNIWSFRSIIIVQAQTFTHSLDQSLYRAIKVVSKYTHL